MARRNTVIDLTLDDDDYEASSPAATMPIGLTTPASVKPMLPSHALKNNHHGYNSSSHRNNNGSSSSNHDNYESNRKNGYIDSKNHDDDRSDRPSKRRRLDASTHASSPPERAAAAAVTPSNRTGTANFRPGSGSGTPSIDRQALIRCLKQQVIPHIDTALSQLPSGSYEIPKLGRDIFMRIADKDLERHFHRGGGKLTDDGEAHVVGRIRRLLKDLLQDPVSSRRFAPSA